MLFPMLLLYFIFPLNLTPVQLLNIGMPEQAQHHVKQRRNTQHGLRRKHQILKQAEHHEQYGCNNQRYFRKFLLIYRHVAADIFIPALDGCISHTSTVPVGHEPDRLQHVACMPDMKNRLTGGTGSFHTGQIIIELIFQLLARHRPGVGLVDLRRHIGGIRVETAEKARREKPSATPVYSVLNPLALLIREG